MLGVEAISGGLISLLVLCGALILALFGIGVGIVFLMRRKYPTGLVLVTSALGIISLIAMLLYPAFYTPVHEIAVDMRNADIDAWTREPFSCTFIGEEKMCSVSGIAKLRLVLPDGAALTLDGKNLYASFSAQNRLEKVAFSLYPEPDSARMISLLEREEAVATSSAKGGQQEIARFRSAVTENGLVKSDKHVTFKRDGYNIHLWLLPRNDLERGFFIWYEILFAQNSNAIS